MAIQRQTEDEIVFATPHRRVGALERPIITLRRGAPVIAVQDRAAASEPLHLPLSAVEAVRLVPEAGGAFHRWRSRGQRWTLTLRLRSGEDLLLEQHLPAQQALELAQAVCLLGGLRLEETSRRLFGLGDGPSAGER